MEADTRVKSDMGVQKISLDIPKEQYDFVKKKGWKHVEVYLLGIQAKQEHPHLIKRIEDLERYRQSAFNRIAGLIKEQSNQEGRIMALERKVAEIEALLPPKVRARIKTEVVHID